MVEINGKQLCENCFEEIATPFCTHCGYNAASGANDPTMLKPGSILLGKYIVGKVMGKGGFGITYLAYDVTSGRKVAIKEFFPYGVALRATGTTTVSVASMDNAEAFKLGAEKFYNEAKLVSKFNGNPNIVGVYEFFYENDTVYFAMEYLEGRTLKEFILEKGMLSAAQALFVAQNVSNALMAAHSSNVLHRDISPDNIIVCDNGDIKLIDFGAARQVVAEHSQSFSVILKPGFAPLEQYQKKGNQGPWTDIYSLGATLYYALTTDIPEDPMTRLDDDEEYSSNQYNIDQELWSVITKATELKIDDRYGDVFQLRTDLAKISFAAEPLVASKDQMPEFQTAMPFGMTQAVPQPVVNQPVGVGAPVQAYASAPVQAPVNAAAPVGAPTSVSAPVNAAAPVGAPAPVSAPVNAAAPVGAPAPVSAPVNAAAPVVPAQQSAPNGTGAPVKKSSKGKIAGICAGVAAVVAAVIIIPIAVMSNSGGSSSHTSTNHRSPDSSKSSSSNYSTPSYSSTPSSPSPSSGSTTVTAQDIDNKLKYTGEWANGMPQGYGYAYYIENTYSYIEMGQYDGGMLVSGANLEVGNNNTYLFYCGNFNGKEDYGYAKWGSGEGYRENRFVDSEYPKEYYYGTFSDGDFVGGEYMYQTSSNNATVSIGYFLDGSVWEGYYLGIDSNGIYDCIVVSSGVEERISADQAKNIGELSEYNKTYLSNTTSNHYGYAEVFNQLATILESLGGTAPK